MTKSILSAIGIQPESVIHEYEVACLNLTSLEGAPRTIFGNFNVACNELTSLDGIPSFIHGHCYVFGNKLTSLHNVHKHIKYLNGFFNCKSNPITSEVLGLLLIDGIKGVWIDGNLEVEQILNKYIQGDKDVFACQEELIEGGFEEYARL